VKLRDMRSSELQQAVRDVAERESLRVPAGDLFQVEDIDDAYHFSFRLVPKYQNCDMSIAAETVVTMTSETMVDWIAHEMTHQAPYMRGQVIADMLLREVRLNDDIRVETLKSLVDLVKVTARDADRDVCEQLAIELMDRVERMPR
jgi:hypothetical protein